MPEPSVPEPSVLFVKPGAIKPNDKGRLFKAGVIVVEVDDPTAINWVRPSNVVPVEELSHGELLFALAKASLDSGYTSKVGMYVAEAIKARHGRPKA